MSRIGERFARLRREGQKAFVAFITAGDPGLDRTVEAALELEAGASTCSSWVCRSRTRWRTGP